MLETTQIKQRLPFIDLIRGITIIEMISYHFLWDLVYLYNADIPWYKSQGMKQLMAGGGVALIGTTLVPLLSGLFG